MRAAAMTVVWVLAMMAGARVSADQQPAPPPKQPDPQQQQQQQQSGLPDLPGKIKIDQAGTILFTDHFGIVFGGIKQGSSIAAGPAASWTFANGAYLQIKGGFSVRQFKLAQVRYDSRRFLGDRAVISTRLRWQDAPKLPLFQPGADSPDRHVDIAMTKTEWSAFMRTRVAPAMTLTVGSGVEGYSSKGKWSDLAEALDRLGELPDAPGLSTRPVYIRSFAIASHDTRLSPEFSRTGHLLEAGFYHYHDGHVGTQSFQRFELAAAQLLPMFRIQDAPRAKGPTRYKSALGVFARAWMSHTGTDDNVPIYLQTFLGGGDYLRGYSSYRFHDRNALLVGTEYRYAVHKMVDVALLLEAGTVARTPSAFNVDDLAPSVAAGVRVHSKTSGLLRLDLAHGRDGFKVAIGLSTGS